MSHFIVIENENGLVVAQVPEGKRADDVAVMNRGVIVDSGPYKSFDDAYDAMQLVPPDERGRAHLLD